MKPTDEPVVVTEQFNKSVEEVWRAITEPKQMHEWFFREMPEFEPKVGFETKFSIQHDEKTYTHQWKITEVESQKRIVYDWTYADTPGRGKVVWELEAVDGGTKLTLTNSAAEAFPEEDPAFHRDSCLQGWQFLINDFLKEFLEPDE